MVRNQLVNQLTRKIFRDDKIMSIFIRGVHRFMCELDGSDLKGREIEVLKAAMQIISSVCHHDNIRAVRKHFHLIVEMCRLTMERGIERRMFFPSHFFVDLVQRMVHVDSEAFDGAAVGEELRGKLRNGVLG